MDSKKTRRITLKYKSANPLFEQWLTEWNEEAKLKASKSHHTFNKALTFLRKCPIPLNSGRECLILKGFGEKLCQMLDQKLQDYQKPANGDKYSDIPKLDNPVVPKISEEDSNIELDTEYIPMPETGEYVILLALYRKQISPNYLGFATKQDIISEAGQFSDISFTKPVKGIKYTAWVARKILVSKNLLKEWGKPLKFSLTDSGFLLAKKLYTNVDNNNEKLDDNKLDKRTQDDLVILDDFPLQDERNVPSSSKDSGSVSNHSSHSQKSITKHPSTCSISSVQSQSQEECLIFQPRSFDIILYVDTAETTGNHGKSKQDAFLTELSKLLPANAFEVKHLSVGDYIWICRERSTGKELVLPYIVERKRLDDFAGSIKDGRYHEQKFRLKRSGVPNKIYLIEKCGGKHVGLPAAALMQAATNTAVQDGFVVCLTADLGRTAAYLSNFTSALTDSFKDKTVMSCSKDNLGEIDLSDDLIPLMTFKEFNQSSMKNKPMKVSDLFVKMLIQLKGISVDRALAIVEIYPTPATLRKTYIENPGTAGEKLLATIKFGKFKKAIGPNLSKTIYQLFTLDTF